MTTLQPYRSTKDEALGCVWIVGFMLVYLTLLLTYSALLDSDFALHMPGIRHSDQGNRFLLSGVVILFFLRFGWLSLTGLGQVADRVWQARAAAEQRELDALAASLGFRLEEDPIRSAPRMVGRRGDVWLSVTLGAQIVWIEAQHRLPLSAPASVRIQRGACLERTGNPVLDSTLSVRGAAAMAPIWTDAAAVEALLAVVHQHPGASVDADTVCLPFPARSLDGLEDRLAEVEALVRALHRVLPG